MQIITPKSGRRNESRICASYKITVRHRSLQGIYEPISGTTCFLSENGLSCKLTTPLSTTSKVVQMEIMIPGGPLLRSGQLTWSNESTHECGIKFTDKSNEWIQFIGSGK